MSSFIIPKLLYICLYSLYGSAIAYLTIFYSEVLHLSSSQIGIILSIAPFVQVVACPLWTLIADRYPKLHGPLMGVLASIGGSSVLILYFLPEWISVKGFFYSSSSSSNDTVMLIAALCAFIFAFFGSPNCALVDSAVLKILGDQKLLYGNQRLWGSVSSGIHILSVGLLISKYGINISFMVFFVGLVSFVILSMFIQFDYHMILKEDSAVNNSTHDAYTDVTSNQQDSSEEEERRSLLAGKSTIGTNYMYNPSSSSWSHQQRPYHSRRTSQQSQNTRHESIANTLYLTDDQIMNALTTTTTSSMAMDVQMKANNKLLQQQSVMFPPLGLVLSYIPTIDTSLSAFALILNDNQDQVEEEEIIIPDKAILKSLLVYTFMISILLYGIAHSMISQFLFLLLKDFGMNSFTIGLTGPIGGAAEVITFWLSRQLFDKYSVTFLMTLAYLSFMFRALVYTCLTSHETKSIIVALLLQIINGFAYALIWSTAVAQVDSFFPVEQRSIAQGILAALFTGLGYGIGCILGGYIFGVYGAIKLFQVSAVICGISLIVFLSGRRRTMI